MIVNFKFLREYNFQSVLTASSIIYGFAAIAPTLIWFVFRQYEPKLKFISIFCLYGYSLISFIPAVVIILIVFNRLGWKLLITQIVCLLPFQFACWLALFSAAAVSGFLLLKNLAPLIVVHAKQQAALLLGFVVYDLSYTCSPLNIIIFFTPGVFNWRSCFQWSSTSFTKKCASKM